MDALAHVWNLRSGSSILALEGHVKSIYGVDFLSDGYHLAIGGDDHICRVWDLQTKECLYIIFAHTSLISQVKYEPSHGYFWAQPHSTKLLEYGQHLILNNLKTFACHDGNIGGLDISTNGRWIGTMSHDMTEQSNCDLLICNF